MEIAPGDHLSHPNCSLCTRKPRIMCVHHSVLFHLWHTTGQLSKQINQRDLLYVAVCFVVVYAPIMCELALCVCVCAGMLLWVHLVSNRLTSERSDFWFSGRTTHTQTHKSFTWSSSTSRLYSFGKIITFDMFYVHTIHNEARLPVQTKWKSKWIYIYGHNISTAQSTLALFTF